MNGRRRTARAWSRGALLAAGLALAALPPYSLAAAPSGTGVTAPAPTAAEVQENTTPLIRSRLRLPESLHHFTVVAVQPTPDDPARYRVEVLFRARSPFGAVTEHRASFRMKRSVDGAFWVVTAD